MKKQVYNSTVEDLVKELGTDTTKGLTDQQVIENKEKYGENKLAEAKKRPLFLKFIDQLKDFMVIILIAAAIISIVMAIVDNHNEDLFEGFLIFAIVIINAVLGLIQEAKAEKALESIKAMSNPHAKVIRNGIETVVGIDEVVVGDLVILEAGDYMPADVRIIKSINLKTDESALTGEPIPVEKITTALDKEDVPLGDRINLGFMSTVVTYGRGLAVVTSVGMQTEIGRIAQMLSETESEVTPLQKNITQLGKILAIISIIAVTIIFVITIVEAAILHGTVTGEEWKSAFITSIALAVAAIPEGLPAIITVVLALGMQNLVKRRAIMRTLPAVETLGSTSIICSDKTGTLTQNIMTVQELYTLKNSLKVKDIKELSPVINDLVTYGALCNDTKTRLENNKYIKLGDPTEVAFIDLAIALKQDPIKIAASFTRVHELPFDSERKLMTTVNSINNETIGIIKGAPDVLLGRATHVNFNGEVIKITPEIIKEFETANNNMANKALRVLAVGYKKVSDKNVTSLSYNQLEQDVILLGLIGMIDPARPEVKDAIVECKQAGITTVMITGDHKNTACAIAHELGILDDENKYLAITGHELDLMTDEEFDEKLPSIRVYARVSPENKVRIVKAWKKTGLIVAMTGDGVNDAPSIKQADIGIAMGITGTEVAKGAADMILTDDNFATIVGAVSEGRTIFANIKKAIHFLLSCNIGEIITIFLGTILGFIIFGDQVPTLQAAQILWVNLVTDSVMAIAIGLDPKEPDIMNHPPRDSKKTIFANGLGLKIAWQGTLLGVLSFAAFTIGWFLHIDNGTDEALEAAQTLTFMVLAISQLFHAFNVRSETRSIFSLKPNKMLFGAFAISMALQLLTLTFNFNNGKNIFGIRVPTGIEWLIIFGLAIVPLVVVELVKLISKLVKKNK